MEKFKISIITINYNDKEGLRKTIASVREQTYNNIEFIVIDGGSTDGGIEVLESNKEAFSFWVSEPDKGIYDAMNKGVAQASGEYCVFMNSGDWFADKDTLSQVIFKAKGADIIYGRTVLTNGGNAYPFREITMDSLFEHALFHQSCLINTKLMKKYGYDTSLRIVADRKFFVQALILDNCTYEPLDIDVAVYDVNGLSSQNPVASRLEYTKVLEELIPERIRLDYGRQRKGVLYGDSYYHKLFAEIGLRQYRKPVYLFTSLLLRFLALFKMSARFVRDFPLMAK